MRSCAAIARFERARAARFYLVVAVDQNVGNIRIGRAPREAEAEQLVQDVDDQTLPLHHAERRRPALLADHVGDEIADLRLGLFASHAVQPLEVQSIQELLVDTAFQLLIVPITSVCHSARWYRKNGIHPMSLR